MGAEVHPPPRSWGSPGWFPTRNYATTEDSWRTWIQLTQAESVFRTEKTELNLRPIRHHLEDQVQAEPVHTDITSTSPNRWRRLRVCLGSGSDSKCSTREFNSTAPMAIDNVPLLYFKWIHPPRLSRIYPSSAPRANSPSLLNRHIHSTPPLALGSRRCTPICRSSAYITQDAGRAPNLSRQRNGCARGSPPSCSHHDAGG